MFSKVTKSQIRMSSSDAKYSTKYWFKALNFTNNSIVKSELVAIIFSISTPGVGLERTNQGHIPDKSDFTKNISIMDIFKLVLGYL